MSRSYTIRGMDCSEEVAALRQTVGQLPNLARLDFNVLDGVMRVTLEGDATPDDGAVVAAVKRAGLEAAPAETGAPAGRGGPALSQTFWQLQGHSLLCGASGAFLALGTLCHAALQGGFAHVLLSGEAGGAEQPPPPVAVAFYVAAIVSGAWFFAPKALAAARRLRPDMNLLMAIAVIGAAAIDQWLEAVTVTFLFAFSLLLESWSVARARRAIRALLDVVPPAAHCLDPATGAQTERPVGEVEVGATVRVRPGERIPLDGVVTQGASTVNQAPITGESLPVWKEPGGELFAGTINETGTLDFRVTRPASDTALSRIIRMVEEAQSRRAPTEQWVEKFARYYTPAMVLAALLVACVPPLFSGGGWAAWFYEALVLLVIACPCALVISTPVSIVAALASAARAGILIKGGAFLEAAAELKTVALDKTGTVTQGHPEVQSVIPLNGHSEHDLLARAAALETHSDHPLARAIIRYAEARQVPIQPAERFRIVIGKGAEGEIGRRRFWLGSHRFLHENGMETSDVHARINALEDLGHSVVVIGNDTHVCGLLSVADTIRKEAARSIRHLKEAGVAQIVLLTGDNEGTAQAVARAVGISDVRAELLPEDKLHAVRELVAQTGPTAMIGDGINDAPALAAATLGIAMGAAGSDAAIETADIALMSDDLSNVPWLIAHARRTRAVIRQNIGFALAVKLAFMLLAVAKLSTLWMAIAADMGASLLVIFNALRLLRTRPKPSGD